MPSTFSAATVSDLIAEINAANKSGGSNTIVLTAPTSSPYVLTAVDNTTNGATGLPVVKPGNSLTIVGNGDTIERSTASGTPSFRLFDVTKTGALTLQNVMLRDGLAFGSGNAADGGAIYNQGTLTLSGVTIQDNTAQGSNGAGGHARGGDGQAAAGGGIWSSGALTLQNCQVLSNSALGGDGGGSDRNGGNGGNAFGGGIYVAAGTLNLTTTLLSGNRAIGGGEGFVCNGFTCLPSGDSGNGFGGGLYVAGGTARLCADTVQTNTAGAFTELPAGTGGGLSFAAGATVDLDAFTVAHTTTNLASIDPDIHGSYILSAC
jgi:hypothetical protein